MKQITVLLSILIFQAAFSDLHAQSWGDWVSFNNRVGVDMSVSFKINAANCTMANGRFRIQNNSYFDKGFVMIAFKYYDCDGNLQDETQSFNLNQTGVDESGGYWFSTSSSRITDIRLDEVYIPGNKIWVKRVNGEIVDVWKQRYGE